MNFYKVIKLNEQGYPEIIEIAFKGKSLKYQQVCSDQEERLNDYIKSALKDEDDLAEDILKVFPKFFGDFKDWQYGNGTDAGKDFERIYNKALRGKTNE